MLRFFKSQKNPRADYRLNGIPCENSRPITTGLIAMNAAATGALDFSPQAADAFSHLCLGELPRAVAVPHRSAQPGDAHPLVDVHIIINTQRPAGRVLVIAFIVVSVYIEYRNLGKCS